MDQCKAQLFLDEDGDVGIQLASQIPASMKSKIYNTEIAATSSKILCASCNCQVGSENGEKILCVHEMVRLYLLMLLLFDCLAESVLLELAA